MSKKHFSWLLIVTFIATGIILLFPGKTGNESTFEVRPLIPGLQARVNAISHVRIVKAGNQPVATLLREDQGWVVEQAQSYPADWVRLKKLLAALAQADIIEPKTSNVAYFDRLGLTDISDETSEAIQLELGEGEDSVLILVGKAAQGRGGQYVRLGGENQALLIDQTLDVASDSSDWLETSIVDLAEAEVVEVNISHADGEKVSAVKISADDTDFTLQEIPEGREIQSAWAVNSLGGSLAGLTLEEAKLDIEIDWSDAIKLRVLTVDGLEVLADLVELEEKQWIRLRASSYPTGAGAAAEDAQVADDVQVSAGEDRRQRVETINSRVAGWVYAIPAYNSQLMSKRMEDLLKPLVDS